MLTKSINTPSGSLNCDSLDSTHTATFTRVDCNYKDSCDKFRLVKKDFSRQYAHIYAHRLTQMKDVIMKRAEAKWGNDVSIKQLAELQEEVGLRCAIIGTLFKHQELKPNILKEISEEFQLAPQQKITKFVSDSDELILEDQLQRIRLIGNIDIGETVTGIVCAVLGKEDDSGKFCVEDICFCGPQSYPSIKPSLTTPEKYAVLISGLDLSHCADSLLPLQTFVDWVAGWSGEPHEQERNSKIALVIFAGNIIRSSSEEKDGKIVNTNVSTGSDIMKTIQLADNILDELSETVNVTLIPGEFDPTNYSIPQQPIHYRLFPKASQKNSLRGGTNPFCAQLEGRTVLGTSGQPVTDILRVSTLSDPLTTLESTLKWGHIAPTAPDTLACYPFYEKDPFIIESQPDIYFAGNQEMFQTKMVNIEYGNGKSYQTRLVCIPSFDKTRTCAVINLNTLEVEPVTFEVGSLSD